MPNFDGEVVRRRQYVREQAAAELPPPPATTPHPMVMPIEMVQVDEDPYDAEGSLRPEWDTLPPRFAAALADVGQAGLGRARCWLCAGPVGYIRTDPITTGAIATWAFVALVWSPSTPETPVNVVCEGCAPITLEEPVSPLSAASSCVATDDQEFHMFDVASSRCRCGALPYINDERTVGP